MSIWFQRWIHLGSSKPSRFLLGKMVPRFVKHLKHSSSPQPELWVAQTYQLQEDLPSFHHPEMGDMYKYIILISKT